MYVMVDNYDSFVYNLAAYFRELGQEIRVVRKDRLALDELEMLEKNGVLDGIIISPGPGSPEEGTVSLEAVRRMAGRVPILGVCLGHQIIGHVLGADVIHGKRPVHGKVTALYNNGTGIFQGLPESYRVTRYHSLVIDKSSLPENICVDAVSADGAVMAISCTPAGPEKQRDKFPEPSGMRPVYGVQFHPEAVLTEYGHELLGNYINICESWKRAEEEKVWRSDMKS